ncbi:MAG: serine protease AprX [Frankiaceae bacterium]|nr:serine protease AprX [Frankiaceae bacterium]
MAARGITWNAVALPDRRALRRSAGIAVLAAAVATSGVSVAIHRSFAPGRVIGVGVSPWFADPSVSPDGQPTLPDMASVEQVVRAPQAWSVGATGAGVDVAVLDSGVTPVQGLDASNKVVYGPDLSFDSQSPSSAFVDGYGHGTAMAGIIAGNDGTAGGFKGVAPGARIVSVKVGAANGAVDVSQIIAGIDWVTQHAHDPGMNIRVLNISLGTDTTQSYLLDPLAHAAEAAWRHGIVVVAAVGNDGAANKTVADPAIDPYVIAVGSEDPLGTINTSDDVVSPFSSRGNTDRHADVVAPGSYLVGLRVPGSYLDTNSPNARVGDRFFRGSGTSQAAAVVSGVVADVLSVRPNLTPDRAKKLLKKTAGSIATDRANFVGAGLVDAASATAGSVDKEFAQTYAPATGLGSLELSRGNSHVASNGVVLTGEQDIFGNPWVPGTIAPAEESAATWSGGTYNGATWSGATWSGATWSGATWSGATWSGATWSSATWSSATWSGSTWSSDGWN